MICDKDQGPSGGRLHWLDLLLGLALLVLVGRAVLQAWPRVDPKMLKTVRLEVAVDDLAAELAAQIATGQWVKDGTTGEFMGKIIKKTTNSGFVPAEHGLGEASPPRDLPAPGLVLVLEREGKIVEREGIFFGRETVRSGQQRNFHTFYVEFTGTINRIVVVKE
ncbi:MAG: hypothetical protein GX770_06075 [Firmicutes bacterium]|nr:hypothetical protein [Bacillota bacterium]